MNLILSKLAENLPYILAGSVFVGLVARILATVWKRAWQIETTPKELGAVVGIIIGLIIVPGAGRSPLLAGLIAGLLVLAYFLVKRIKAKRTGSIREGRHSMTPLAFGLGIGLTVISAILYIFYFFMAIVVLKLPPIGRAPHWFFMAGAANAIWLAYYGVVYSNEIRKAVFMVTLNLFFSAYLAASAVAGLMGPDSTLYHIMPITRNLH